MMFTRRFSYRYNPIRADDDNDTDGNKSLTRIVTANPWMLSTIFLATLSLHLIWRDLRSTEGFGSFERGFATDFGMHE